MSFKIRNVSVENQAVLAPMAGVTNQAYRKMCKQFGAGMVVTEMISDKGIFYHDKKTELLSLIDEAEHPVGVQIFGGDLDTLIYAAKYVDQKTAADFIDLNMGCPVQKVLKSNAGSKYLLDPDKIYTTVSAIVHAISKPVTVKVRIGWDHQSINIDQVAAAIVLAHASAITIHGRTKSDLYGNEVQYDRIRSIKEKYPDFPVIANGDINSAKKAKEVLDFTGADAVMIGRATYGNPYIFTQINHFLKTGELLPDLSIHEKIEILRQYCEALISLKGEWIAIKELRSQAGWFIKGCAKGAFYRNQLTQIDTYDQLQEILRQISSENA